MNDMNNIRIKQAALAGLFFFLCFTAIAGEDVNQANNYVTSAVVSVDAAIIEKNAVAQVDEAMNGTIPGLIAIPVGGQKLGIANYLFYLRGKATTADNTPLVLVDGVDADIYMLDPQEVESITVLKDASELALYGLRGANGVILIKTKQGTASHNFMRVDLRMGVQSPTVLSDKLNAYQYTSLYNEANLNDGLSPVYTPDSYLNASDSYRYPDVRFADEFLRKNAMYNYYNFTAGGGNEVAQYFALLSYTRQDGLFALPSGQSGLNQTHDERYNFRTNIQVNLGKGFHLQTNINAVYDDRRSPWVDRSTTVASVRDLLFGQIMSTPANAYPLLNPDGSLGGTAEYRNNPLGRLRVGERVENTRKLTANVLLKKDLDEWFQGLSLFAKYGFENYNSYYKGNYTSFAVYQLRDDDTYEQYGADETKVTSTGDPMAGYYSDMTIQAGADLDRTFGRHSLQSSLWYNQYTSSVGGDVPDYKWMGTSARVLYGLDNRYFAQLSASYQGSNNYLRGNRYGFFPAFSLGWIASQESFLQEYDWISFLKVRASAGLVGNDRTGGTRFMYRSTYYNGNGYGFGNPNGSSQGSYEGELNNPDASWETSEMMNIGLDFSTLENSLSFSADYFREKRTDILVAQSNVVSSVIGVSLPRFNGGVVRNQGVEANVTYNKTLGKARFYSGLNVLYAKNEILDMKEVNYPVNESYRYLKGNSINTIYGLSAAGIYQSNEEIVGDGVNSSYGQLAPGDIRYQDLNGDGIVNDADKQAVGNSFPELTYGIYAGFEIQGFDLYIQAHGAEMFDVLVQPDMFSVYAYENRWVNAENGMNALYPRLSHTSEHNRQVSSYWMDKGHLLRLSTLELGYTLPTLWTQKLSLSKIRIYTRLNNFFSTKEGREGREYWSTNAGFSEYPAVKTALVGISINL